MKESAATLALTANNARGLTFNVLRQQRETHGQRIQLLLANYLNYPSDIRLYLLKTQARLAWKTARLLEMVVNFLSPDEKDSVLT
jgi:hypothetical protein